MNNRQQISNRNKNNNTITIINNKSLSFCSDLSNEAFLHGGLFVPLLVRVRVLLNLSASHFFSHQTPRCSGFLAIVRNQSPLLSPFLNCSMLLQLEPQRWHTHSPLPKKSSISKRSLFLEQPHRKLCYQRTRRSLSECGILRGQRSTLISATDARTRRHWNVMQWLDNDRGGSKNICIFFRSASAEGRTDNNCSADCPCNLLSLTHQESQDRLHGPVKRARPSCCCCICLHQPRFRRPSSTTCAVSSAETESNNRYPMFSCDANGFLLSSSTLSMRSFSDLLGGTVVFIFSNPDRHWAVECFCE